MKKSSIILLFSSFFVFANCNKIAQQGGKVVEKTVAEKSVKVVLSKSLQERMETAFGTDVAVKLAKTLEDKPELVKLLEKNGNKSNSL